MSILTSDDTPMDLGFPEFESIHSTDFSVEAQFSKSVASTIPPRPLRPATCDRQSGISILQMKHHNRSSFFKDLSCP